MAASAAHLANCMLLHLFSLTYSSTYTAPGCAKTNKNCM